MVWEVCGECWVEVECWLFIGGAQWRDGVDMSVVCSVNFKQLVKKRLLRSVIGQLVCHVDGEEL